MALYQPDAVVTDSLAGVTARGAAQIADLADAPATAGGLGQAVVDQLPDYRGPPSTPPVAPSRTSRSTRSHS